MQYVLFSVSILSYLLPDLYELLVFLRESSYRAYKPTRRNCTIRTRIEKKLVKKETLAVEKKHSISVLSRCSSYFVCLSFELLAFGKFHSRSKKPVLRLTNSLFTITEFFNVVNFHLWNVIQKDLPLHVYLLRLPCLVGILPDVTCRISIRPPNASNVFCTNLCGLLSPLPTSR